MLPPIRRERSSESVIEGRGRNRKEVVTGLELLESFCLHTHSVTHSLSCPVSPAPAGERREQGTPESMTCAFWGALLAATCLLLDNSKVVLLLWAQSKCFCVYSVTYRQRGRERAGERLMKAGVRRIPVYMIWHRVQVSGVQTWSSSWRQYSCTLSQFINADSPQPSLQEKRKRERKSSIFFLPHNINRELHGFSVCPGFGKHLLMPSFYTADLTRATPSYWEFPCVLLLE